MNTQTRSEPPADVMYRAAEAITRNAPDSFMRAVAELLAVTAAEAAGDYDENGNCVECGWPCPGLAGTPACNCYAEATAVADAYLLAHPAETTET